MDAIAKAFLDFRKYFDAHGLDPDLASSTLGGVAYG
jgi:hypothetical protein